MGGPYYADQIHKLIDVIHAELIVELEQQNNNNNERKEGINSEDKAVEHERQVGKKYTSDLLDESEEPPKKRLRLLHAMSVRNIILQHTTLTNFCSSRVGSSPLQLLTTNIRSNALNLHLY